LPWLFGPGTASDPSQGEIGQFQHAGIESSDGAQVDESCILSGHLAPVQELPASVVLVVGHVEDRRVSPKYPPEGQDSEVLEGPYP
jgi:hypothetical protein